MGSVQDNGPVKLLIVNLTQAAATRLQVPLSVFSRARKCATQNDSQTPLQPITSCPLAQSLNSPAVECDVTVILQSVFREITRRGGRSQSDWTCGTFSACPPN